MLSQKKILPKNNPFVVARNQKLSLNLFWFGFVIYNLSGALSVTGSAAFSPLVCQAIQGPAIALLIFGSVGLMKYKFDDSYLQTIFTIYFVYSLTIIPRGFQTDFTFIKKMFFDPTGGLLPFFTPLVILMPRNLGFYKKIFNILVILGAFFIIFSVAFIDVMMDPDWLSLLAQAYVEVFYGLLALPIGFILITYVFQSTKVKVFALGVLLLACYFLLYRARRGSLAICLATMAGAGMVYLIYTKRTVIVIILSVLLAAGGSVMMSGMKVPGMFSFIMARKDEDTRSNVEQYMYADMTTKDWIIGKGISGKYYCPTVISSYDNSFDRDIIETGYLQIILKGGILSFGLLLCIVLPAIYKGLSDSKNILAKGASIFLLVWTVSLYPTIGNEFSMRYLLVWICIGICYSKPMRYMSDVTIKTYLQRS